MATHSSVLAWRIPGTVEPGGLLVCGVAQSRTRLKQLSSSSIKATVGEILYLVIYLCQAISVLM